MRFTTKLTVCMINIHANMPTHPGFPLKRKITTRMDYITGSRWDCSVAILQVMCQRTRYKCGRKAF